MCCFLRETKLKIKQSDDSYGNIACCYDLFTARLLKGIRQRIVTVCLEQKFSRILDVGCGTGVLLRMLRASGAQAYGIDFSRAMLLCLAKEKLPGIVIEGDAAQLPFCDNAFDVLIYSLVLHETDADPLGLLEEGFRLSRFLLILEWHVPERNLDYASSFWVPVVERLAGMRHYVRYRSFMRRGGLFGLTAQTKSQLLWSQRLAAGSLILALVKRSG